MSKEKSEKEKTLVFVALLNQGTVSAGLEPQLYNWMQDLGDKYNFQYTLRSDRPISSNRNKIVKDFLETDCKFLVMIDDDNPPVKNPFELLDYNKDVIGAIVPGRDDWGIHWHVYEVVEDNPKTGIIHKAHVLENGLQKVDAVSTGCIIIKRKVLEKIKKPFEDLFDKDGVIMSNDDLYFAHKVRKAGFQEWIHSDYICSHYKTVDLLQMLRLNQIAIKRAKANNINIKAGKIKLQKKKKKNRKK